MNAPLERLLRAGWQVVDGPEATVTPAKYQDFILGSRGEISPAKHVYVPCEPDGSAAVPPATWQLAALGGPGHGFSSLIPCGKGILAFNSAEEAADALRKVENDYAFHAKARFRCRREYFDSSRVLGKMIEDAL
jgi:hypothetical protein